MGVMIEGRWHDRWYDTKASGGRFVRSESQFRNWVTPDGAAGPTGIGGYRAEAGRYHLYAALACPWSHRTLIFRALKGLTESITVSVTHWRMGADGWTFDDGAGVIPDPILGASKAYEVYKANSVDYTGRVTVPILWDRETATIVSNESADIIRMMNSAFDQVGAAAGDYYPERLRPDIDRINAEIYERVNNGVYKAGFATGQRAYEEAVVPLFATLDDLELLLGDQRYLCGPHISEADWRLFPTLVRFDAVYVGHFKCNIRRLSDYPNLWAYTRELFQWPGIRETVDFEHIKRHYYESHESINPSRVVPLGPILDFDEPHGRDSLTSHPIS
ncbi:MAG: Glutathione transferase [Bradyrhizobium sp.]|nr:Glutathione transferase [Bradyrhizobium sp.]